jgi:hypothetical protein
MLQHVVEEVVHSVVLTVVCCVIVLLPVIFVNCELGNRRKNDIT